MAAKPKPKGGANALTRKLGPLPVWAWGAAGIVVFLLVRHYSSSLSGGTSALTPSSTGAGGAAGTGTDTSGSGGGGVGATSGTGTDSGYGAATYGLLTQLLAGQTQQTQELQTAFSSLTPPAASTTNNYYGTQPTPSASPSLVSSSPAASPLLTPTAPVSSGQPTPDFEQSLAEPKATVTYNPGPLSTQPQTLSSAAAGVAAAAAATPVRAAPSFTPAGTTFGGVLSTRTLKNGATLTTYASGRQVEQAPGKSAYVVHK